MLTLALYVLGNLAGSFFCSLSEAALLACSEARILARIEHGDRRAVRLLELKRDPGRTLAAIVFLNNIFAIGGTAAITAVATNVIPEAVSGTGITPAMGMGIFIVIQTLLIIAFGEITPKVLGEAQPELIAGRVTPAVVVVRRVLRPLVWLVERIVAWARPAQRVLAGEEAEIRELARLGEEGGHIDPEEAELIRRVFRLDDITAEDVMTPRPLIHAFSASSRLEDIREDLLSASHYQFPVCEEDLDKVTGVLVLRKALIALARGEGDRTVGELQTPALFLPTSRKVDDVLRDLQAQHGGLAVVIDEYGVTEGIITMDDLVEELVGEAIDDADLREGLVKRLSRDVALVHGLTRVRDIARFLNCPVVYQSMEEENTTITGLIQERLQRIPQTGDRIEVDESLSFEVKEADERTALRVLARHHRAPVG
ncbi:MAG: hemolysin family protein [Planctomycetota bacterium]|nr:hemolysin family protein [Planctomycetota bacterium]